jgi:hypothetical protein
LQGALPVRAEIMHVLLINYQSGTSDTRHHVRTGTLHNIAGADDRCTVNATGETLNQSIYIFIRKSGIYKAIARKTQTRSLKVYA